MPLFPCQLCNKICKNQRGLTQHHRSTHGNYHPGDAVPDPETQAGEEFGALEVEEDSSDDPIVLDTENEESEEEAPELSNHVLRSRNRPAVDESAKNWRHKNFRPLIFEDYRIPSAPTIGQQFPHQHDELTRFEEEVRNNEEFFQIRGVPPDQPRNNPVLSPEDLGVIVNVPTDFVMEKEPDNDLWVAADDSSSTSDGPTVVSVPTGYPMGNSVSFSVSPNDPAFKQNTLSAHDLAHLRLMQYCDRHGCPRHFINGLIDLLREVMVPSDGYSENKSFNPDQALRRDQFLDKIMRTYGDESMKPQAVDVRLCRVRKWGKTHGEHVAPREEGTDPNNPEEYPDLIRTDPWKQILEMDPNKKNKAVVVRFNIEACVRSLLDDMSVFGDLDNLVVNPPTENDADAPFRPYRPKDGILDEVLDGTWYRDTLFRMDIGPEESERFVLPLIGYVDKTGTDKYNRYSLEPFSITTAVHRRKVRYGQNAWRIIGLIPDLELKSKVSKQTAPKGVSNANYHECLAEVLRGLSELETKGFEYFLRLGDRVKRVRIICPLAFIIGDAKSGDTLCSRYAGYGKVGRVCRSCDVTYDNLHRPDVRCSKLKHSGIRKLLDGAHKNKKQDIDRLAELSIYLVENAFDTSGITFGGDKYRVYGCTPTDLMHAFLLGLVRYCVLIVVQPLSPTRKREVDFLVDELLVGIRSSARKEFPRASFAKGFTNLTNVTADEWMGMLFTLVLVLTTERGAAICEPRFSKEDVGYDFIENAFGDIDASRETQEECGARMDEEEWEAFQNYSPEKEDKDEDEDVAPSRKRKKTSEKVAPGSDGHIDESVEEEHEDCLRKCSLVDFIQVAEALLCFHAWYKREDPIPWTEEDQVAVDNAIRRMMALVRHYLPRAKGNGWHLQKFHEIMHAVFDMTRFGISKNYDASTQETGLIKTKALSETAQKRGAEIFTIQTGSRVYENIVKEKALRINGVPDDGTAKPRVAPPANPKPSTKEETLWNDWKAGDPPMLGGSHCLKYLNNTKPPEWSGAARRASKNPVGYSCPRTREPQLHPLVEKFFHAGPYRPDETPDLAFETRTDKEGNLHRFHTIYTELKMTNLNDDSAMLIRAHPDYQSEGAFYDWVLVDFVEDQWDDEAVFEDGPPKREPIPSKCIGFVQSEGQCYALVHSCFARREYLHQFDSTIFQNWRLEYGKWGSDHRDSIPGRADPTLPPCGRKTIQHAAVRLVSVDCIVRQCFVMEEKPGLKEAIEIDLGEREKERQHMRKVLRENTNRSFRAAHKECRNLYADCIVVVQERRRWHTYFI